MKIIIFGGSFDPIHEIHLKMAKDAFGYIKADKLFFVLCYSSLDKKKERCSYFDRLQMIKIAIKNYPNFDYCEFEKILTDFSYTYKTINHFKSLYPNAELYLLVGSDQYNNFKNWKNYEEIINQCQIICYKRKNFDIFEKLPNSIFIDNNNADISSTDIINNPKYDLINRDVLNYINQNGIYAIYRLKKYGLSQYRINHSIEVSHLCCLFASKYGHEITKKAYVSGLYHDICKEWSENDSIELAKKLNIKNFKSWKILHSYIGSYILKTKYLFDDEDVLEAVYNHTIPESNKLLVKILYCADKLAYRPNENFDKRIELINLCKSDIDQGFDKLYKILSDAYK